MDEGVAQVGLCLDKALIFQGYACCGGKGFDEADLLNCESGSAGFYGLAYDEHAYVLAHAIVQGHADRVNPDHGGIGETRSYMGHGTAPVRARD